MKCLPGGAGPMDCKQGGGEKGERWTYDTLEIKSGESINEQ